MTTIESELAALEAADATATPGPWRVMHGDSGRVVACASSAVIDSARDSLFIVLARSAVPKLIAEVRMRQAAMTDLIKAGVVICCTEYNDSGHRHAPDCAERPDRKFGEP